MTHRGHSDRAPLTSLVLEHLYYADVSHHPEHPNHGRFKGKKSSTQSQL
jgi:hypothetical protein